VIRRSWCVRSRAAGSLRDHRRERRWRASQLAGLQRFPIVPVDVSDSDALEIMIIENVQREDLNRWKKRRAITRLRTNSNAAGRRSQRPSAEPQPRRQHDAADKLPAEVQAYIAKGELSAGHARALIGVPDPLAAAKRIVAEGLNVRQAEALAA